MKKAIFTLIALLVANYTFAQLTNVKDTVFATMPLNSTLTIPDTLFNFGTTDIPVTWNLSPASIIAPGHFGISLCFFPGGCYNFDNTVRTNTIVSSSAGTLLLSWQVDATAAIGSTSYVILNTDIDGGKDLVRKITVVGAVSVDESEMQSIKLYPQPAAGILNVETPDANTSRIDIVNVCGSIVKTTPTHGKSQTEISVSNLSPGLYIANIYDGDNHIVARKKFNKN